ncbi:MAG: sugar ABC transporter permease [Treponema sp.]|nr:sugar ABC transporter permease [Treponema sp.]
MKNKPAGAVLLETINDMVFLLPALALFLLLIIIPFFMGFVYAFTDWNGITVNFNFVGFSNFLKVFQERRIGAATWHTVQFTLMQTISVNIIGLLLALAIERGTKLNRIMRTVFFIPFMCSIVFGAFIWSYFYSSVLEGIFRIINPLSRMNTVIPGIAIIALWRDAGYAMLIYLAALQAIPESLYEAAVVEGIGRFQKFFYITLPLIVPAFTVNLTLFIGWGLKTYDYVVAATGGGPGSASETIAMLVYYYTFPWQRTGLGQAFAILMMIGIVIVTQGIARALRAREVEY